MNDEKSTAIDLMTSLTGSVPEPVATAFFKAVSELLGGFIAIPAAKLQQYAQGIHDVTVARSAVTSALAKAAAEDVAQDRQLVKSMAEVLVPSSVRKVQNRFRVTQKAAEHLEAQTAQQGSDNASSPDADWMNTFMRHAEDASSERLQDLFGRILAGQVVRPGAFGPATLRALSELDQKIAEDFMFAWEKSVGDAVDLSPEWQIGDGFTRLTRLREAGLMANTDIATYSPAYSPVPNMPRLWAPMQAGGTYLNIVLKANASAQWNHIEFTRVGREIGSLLAQPDYANNMRRAAHLIPKHGLLAIHLYAPNIYGDLIWVADSA